MDLDQAYCELRIVLIVSEDGCGMETSPMRNPMRKSLASIVLLFSAIAPAGPDSALAQPRAPTVVRSGQPSVIYVFYGCGPRGVPPTVSGTASNGTITTRPGTRNRCGKTNHPVVEVVYTSRPNYRGPDEATLHGPDRPQVKITVQ
jgi:hypothetical protein